MAASFTYVGQHSHTSDGSNTSVSTQSPGYTITAGNLVVVVVRWEGGGLDDSATATISDDAGNTYVNAGYKATGAASEDQKIGFWYVLSCTGQSNNIVTASISASRSFRRIAVLEYSYSGTIQLNSTAADGAGSSTSFSATPTQAGVNGDLSLFVDATYLTTVDTVDAPHTTRIEPDALMRVHEYILTGTDSSITPSGSYDGTEDWCTLAFVFESADSSSVPAIVYHRRMLGMQ